ncbi:MAG: hypothetical protein GY898_07275 [Proteobacteria bacterium]|nr:hypothetical protein [Pseudomonadota bacterium]
MRDSGRNATFAAGLLVGLAVVLRLRPLRSLDLWWHLSMGEQVRASGSRTFDDSLSWGTGHPYTDPEWLFDVGALTLWELGGVAAMVLMPALLAGASAALAWLLAASLLGPRRPWAAVLIAALAVGGSSWRFDPRPQSLFLVLLPATLWFAAMARGSTGRARWGWLAATAATLAIWTQSHSSMVIGPCVAWAMLLPRGEPDAPWRPPHLALIAALAAMPLLGPFGLDVIGQVVGHAGSDAAQHITDMRPMPLSGWIPRMGSSVLYVELIAGLGLAGVVLHRKAAPGPLALVLLGFAMTLTAHRFRAAWALMAIPLAVEAVRHAAAWTEDGWGPRLSAASVVLIPLALAAGEPGPSLRWERTSVPGDATSALAALEFEGRLFNDYDGGGWVGWDLGPEVQVFIDGRTPTHFSGERFAEARAAYEDGDAFRALHREHAFGGVLIRRDQGLCDDLVADAGWEPVWFGEQRAVFLPATGRGLTSLSACTSASSVGRCLAAEDAAPSFAELDRIRALDPAHGYLDRLGVALALHCAQNPTRATDHLTQALRFDPTHPDLPRFTATIQLGLGRNEQALQALIGAADDDGAAIDLELQALQALNRPADALPLARARTAELGDAAPRELRALLAWACNDAGDDPCVVAQATRAALLGDDGSLALLRDLDARGALPSTHRGLLEALNR